jgi:peptidoglycan/xylan/chitin deacetylase (PgdA/CDA1 family)
MGVFTDSEPELTKRGLHGGYGVIVGKCDTAGSGTWAQVKGLVANGHDVFNHSWSHPCMTNDANLASSCDPAAPHSVDFANEIGKSGTTLKANIGLPLDFFIFPYDVCDPTAIAYLKSNGYLGARCGTLNVNTPTFADPFAVNYDVFGPSYSRYFGQASCAKTAAGAAPVQYTTLPSEYTDACRMYVLNQNVDDAIAAKGWAVREMHGFDPGDIPSGGWEVVTLPDYQAHLDYLVTRVTAGALWVEGPSRVIRYRFARDTTNCALPTITAGRTLQFSAPSANCQKYATVLSYKVSTTDGSDPASVQVNQGGVLLPAKRVSAGHYVVDADPTLGNAEIVP